MKCLIIQLQAGRDLSFQIDDVLYKVRSIGRYPEIDIDEENPNNVNLNFFTEDLGLLWPQLKKGLLEDKELGEWLKRVSIIVCEGDAGWDDYLLLWHYDEKERKGLEL